MIIARKIPALAEAASKIETQEIVYQQSIIKEKVKFLLSYFKKFCIYVFQGVIKKIFRIKNIIKEISTASHIVQKQLLHLVAKKPSSIQSGKKISELPVIASPQTLLNKASNLVENNQLDEAEKIYIEVIKKDPKNIKAYQALGEIYLKRHNFGDAKASFRQVIKLDPQNEEAQLQLKKLDEATKEAKEKIEEK